MARTSMSRWLWLASLVAAGALAYLLFVLFTAPGRRLQAQLQRAKSAGVPLTMAEVAPPPVPDDKNAAILYEQAFSFLPTGTDATLVADFVSRGDRRRRRVSIQDAERVVANSAVALDLLEKGAARPACRFPVNWEDAYYALFPHLSKVRNSARLLAAKAVLDARRGDTSEALDAIATIFRMSDHIAVEPTLIAQLVRGVCQVMATDALNRVVQTAPPAASDARRMYDVLRKVDNMTPFRRAIEGERCAGLAAFAMIEQDPRWGLGPFPGTPKHAILEDWSARARFLVSLPSFFNDQALFLHASQASADLSRRPYRQIAGTTGPLASAANRLNRYHLFSQLGPGFPIEFASSRDAAIARLGLAQHGLALAVYRQAVGHHPHSLAQLRTKVTWELPPDPFSGKDFIYSRKDGGYLIYSIGPNMKDQGGKDRYSVPGPLPAGQQRPDDITWRITR